MSLSKCDRLTKIIANKNNKEEEEIVLSQLKTSLLHDFWRTKMPLGTWKHGMVFWRYDKLYNSKPPLGGWYYYKSKKAFWGPSINSILTIIRSNIIENKIVLVLILLNLYFLFNIISFVMLLIKQKLAFWLSQLICQA